MKLLILCLLLSSCASMLPKLTDRIYYCTTELIDEGVKPLEAEQVCTNIFSPYRGDKNDTK